MSHYPKPMPVPDIPADDAPAPTPTPTPEPPDGPNDPPGPPAYVGLYGSATDLEVIATWPEPTTGGDVQVYIVCINKVGSDVMNCVSTADRMHTFENLELGSYWVTVKAKNAGGESAPAREGITLAQP